MKIILGHNFYRSTAPSGEDGVYQNERKLLENNGVDIISYEKFNDDLDDSSFSERITIALDGAWSNNTYRELTDLIQKNKPDLAHFHSIFPQISPSAYTACKDNNIPVIHTLHNYRPICPGAMLIRDGKPCEDCLGTNLLPSLLHKCYRGSLLATGAITWQIVRNRLTHTYQKVSKYIVLTEFAASRYIKAGFSSDKIIVKPNFLPSRRLVSSCSDTRYAVYVGRLSEEKGVRTMLNAWQRVKELPLKILGDGPLRNELEQFVRANDLNVEFLGFIANDRVLEIIGNAQLQVIPSEWYEGFPMVVLESYALGVPLIASRIGSLEEVVLEGETGLKFTPGNADELAEKVNCLINDDNSRAKMRMNARKLFEQKYTAEANIKMLHSIYEQVIQENKSAD